MTTYKLEKVLGGWVSRFERTRLWSAACNLRVRSVSCDRIPDGTVRFRACGAGHVLCEAVEITSVAFVCVGIKYGLCLLTRRHARTAT